MKKSHKQPSPFSQSSADQLSQEKGNAASLKPPALSFAQPPVQRNKKGGETEKPARIHIHADIEAESMGISELRQGAVGHAWVSLEWKDPAAIPAKVATEHPDHAHYLQARSAKGMFADPFGFWPYMFSEYDEALDQWGGADDRVGYSSNPFKSYVKGQMVHPDTLHESKVRATQSFDITESQAIAAMNYAESKKAAQYSVFYYNCTTFAEEAVKAAGKSPPKASKMGIAYPNKLYDSIVANQKSKTGHTTVWDKDRNMTEVEGTETKKNQ